MRSDTRNSGSIGDLLNNTEFLQSMQKALVLIECGKTKVICTATVEDSKSHAG